MANYALLAVIRENMLAENTNPTLQAISIGQRYANLQDRARFNTLLLVLS